ncbi:MAG TPA: hypothetical protein VGB13_04695 [Candidatus Krumholzibacteria bacterium]
MKAPQYTVVEHLELFRIVGLTGIGAIPTFRERKVAEDVCRMLSAAYEQGAAAKLQEIRDVLGIVGGRR